VFAQQRRPVVNAAIPTVGPVRSRPIAPVRRPIRDGLPLQAKLIVGGTCDALEVEADRVADRVMQSAERPATGARHVLQRACAKCDEEEKIRRKGEGGSIAGMEAPPIVHDVLRSSGQPLDAGIRALMEPRLGYDFGRVRVHTDAQATRSAEAIGARAYTVGSDIVVRQSDHAPGTRETQRLMAHELTHVVQQLGSTPRIQRQPGGPAPSTQPSSTQDLRIYSFGPTGGGRVQTKAATTMFSSSTPVDAQGMELVRAGSNAGRVQSRFGRYFTVDTKSQPLPTPTPHFAVRFTADWVPDDGTRGVKTDQKDDAPTYWGPEQPLGTTLGTEWVFSHDKPGRLTIVYSLTGDYTISMTHGVRFVNDPNAQPGAQKPRRAAVESFVVEWEQDTQAYLTNPGFALVSKARLRNDVDYDPALVDFRQNVMTNYQITAGPHASAPVPESMHNDNYSRDDDLLHARESPDMTLTDNPNIGPLDKDDVINYSFTAEQMLIDLSNGNNVLAKRGPHTATITGKEPRQYAGVPVKLDR
jgi:hypothetical protein